MYPNNKQTSNNASNTNSTLKRAKQHQLFAAGEKQRATARRTVAINENNYTTINDYYGKYKRKEKQTKETNTKKNTTAEEINLIIAKTKQKKKNI